MSQSNITCAADTAGLKSVPAPTLDYLPRGPKSYRPAIGLIGCGGISAYHLAAYQRLGYAVVALCDVDEARARERRDAYYPDARVYTDAAELIRHDGIEVVDMATHPEIRAAMIREALLAGKHVLSQKPFVLDLDLGESLADLADERGLKLAVNQNGRWAPHFSYLRHAVAAGLLGEVFAMHLAVHWDHSWTAGTVFDELRQLILYDFGIHWFDITACVLGERKAMRVYASTARVPGQPNRAALLAQAQIEFEGAQASLSFDAYTNFGAQDTTFVAGTEGSFTSAGPDLQHQSVTLYRGETYAIPELQGDWFTNGFEGTMAELLSAIEENREPVNGARNNLRSLALCFAAMASADSGEPKVPGTVRSVRL